MTNDREIQEGLIVEGYYLHPKELVIFRAHPDLENNQILLEPLSGERYQVRISLKALLEGGKVSGNLRLIGLYPQENDPKLD